MNMFSPWIGPGGSYDILCETFQALGVRYVLTHGPLAAADERKFAGLSFPRRHPPARPASGRSYQLPDPNMGKDCGGRQK
jgi:hypothetical protein